MSDPQFIKMLTEEVKQSAKQPPSTQQVRPPVPIPTIVNAAVNATAPIVTSNAAPSSYVATPTPSAQPSVGVSSSSQTTLTGTAQMKDKITRLWWNTGFCATVSRAVAGSLIIAIVLVIMRPEAVLKRPKHRDGKKMRDRYRRVNYGSVCILSTLTGILATCMFGG